MADLQQIMQLGQQLQGRLQQLETDLADRAIDAAAGGGMVRVTVDGRGALRSLNIDPAVFDDHDADFLAELILSAISEAQRRAMDERQSAMQQLQPSSFPTSP
jgi:DNA-binding YbaB/EbfC family protein